jgi:hypothetical protein
MSITLACAITIEAVSFFDRRAAFDYKSAAGLLGSKVVTAGCPMPGKLLKSLAQRMVLTVPQGTARTRASAIAPTQQQGGDPTNSKADLKVVTRRVRGLLARRVLPAKATQNIIEDAVRLVWGGMANADVKAVNAARLTLATTTWTAPLISAEDVRGVQPPTAPTSDMGERLIAPICGSTVAWRGYIADDGGGVCTTRTQPEMVYDDSANDLVTRAILAVLELHATSPEGIRVLDATNRPTAKMRSKSWLEGGPPTGWLGNPVWQRARLDMPYGPAVNKKITLCVA